jgi:hypothetical protein
MKKIIPFVLLSLFTANYSFGQIPNPSFENWTGTQPDGWVAYRTNPFSPFIFETISTNAHNGSIAVKSNIVLTGPVYNPSGLLSASEATDYYFPITTKPTKLKGWYILQTNGLDTFTVNVTMKRQGAIIGQGEFTSTTTNLSYSEFITNINYSNSTTPDSMKIFITFNYGKAGSGHEGSYFILDDLYLSQTSGLDENQSTPFIQFSPNPSTSSIEFKTTNADQILSFELINSFGQVLETIQNPSSTENIDVSNYDNGVYFYRVFTTDNIIQTGKLIKN